MGRLTFVALLLVTSSDSLAEELLGSDSSSQIPFKQESDSIQSAPADTLIALVLVLGLCIGILFLLRQFLRKKGVVPQPQAGDRISVLSNKRIMPGMTATLLAVDDKEYLVVNKGDQLSVTEHMKANGNGNPQNV
ncbi:MAG: hypothetical protein JXR18_16750 [Neptuniibacter sp.]